MKAQRSSAGLRASPNIHLGVLAVSVAAAIGVWTRDKEPKALSAGDVVVWSGRSGDVEKIAYDTKTRKVEVESKKDGEGRYFVGSLERDPPPAPQAADGGAPPPAPPKTTIGFVSVGPGEKLAEALAPLKALRTLGKIGDDRAAEFGLADPEGTLTVKVGGTERKMLVGSATPGGGDRYVRDTASNEVYVVKGEPLRNLESPDSLLIEHDLHDWKDADVARIHVEAGSKSHDLVRGGPETKRFWADAATPETNDETVGNWMNKLDHLRPTEYALTDPPGKETLFKISYTGKKPLGFIEVVKVTGGDKPTYYVRTERTRLFGKVASTFVEPLEQDLGSIVKM